MSEVRHVVEILFYNAAWTLRPSPFPKFQYPKPKFISMGLDGMDPTTCYTFCMRSLREHITSSRNARRWSTGWEKSRLCLSNMHKMCIDRVLELWVFSTLPFQWLLGALDTKMMGLLFAED